MRVEEVFERDVREEAHSVYGTIDPRHSSVAEMNSWGRFNISGALRVLTLLRHFDLNELRLTPCEVRRRLAAKGVRDVVAFQTRNPLHRAHEELTRRAADRINGTLLLHPAGGMTKPGDIDHFTRVRSYKALVEHYDEAAQTLLALTPLAMRIQDEHRSASRRQCHLSTSYEIRMHKRRLSVHLVEEFYVLPPVMVLLVPTSYLDLEEVMHDRGGASGSY